MATQTGTQQPFDDCGSPGCGSEYGSDVPDPGVSGDLQTTSHGTCINVRSFAGGTYGFEFSLNSSGAASCGAIALADGSVMSTAWNRLSGQDSVASAYVDTWMPGGASSVFSFLPRLTVNDIPTGGQRIYSKSSPVGTISYDSANAPQGELPLSAFRTGSTYFTTYDQKAGVYFEYFGGGLATSDFRYGRINRRYSTKGNVVQYNYAPNAQGNALLRSLSGNIAGNIVPYFYYANETIDASHFAPITQMSLLDQATPQNTRTTYYTYTNETDAGGNVRPFLTQITNPVNCVEQYAPVSPFPLGDPGDPYLINNDTDASGFGTSFTYNGGLLSGVVEPESRITYYEEPSVGETHQIQQGRSARVVKYDLSPFGDQITRVNQHTDPLSNTTYYGYDTTLSRIVNQVDPSGNLTYFGYSGGTNTNKYALTRKLSTFNQAQTYFGYNPDAGGFPTYDLVKKVGPLWQAGTNIEVTYYRYDASRNRTAMVDALGNQTLYGPDSLGRNIRIQDARGSVTYYNYGASAASLDSTIDAVRNVAYYGYNSFLNRTAEVSPRWPEQTFAAFTTYYVYDGLNRKTKTIDAQNNVTYFDWTSRSDLADTVDPALTETAYTYNGLRQKTLETVTDAAAKLLSVTYHGYDAYKNKVRMQDGRGNTTYYFYDQINRPIATVDALQEATYFYYDSVSNLTAQTDARANTTYHFYDLLTRKTAMRDALGNPTYYFYDLANNPTSQVDALGFPSYFFYDGLDRRQATRDALGNPTYYFYDPVGNQSAVTDARNDTTYYFYDPLNRQSVTRDALGNPTYYGYDARGNRIRVKDARLNTTYFTYDTLNRMSRTVDALSNPTYYFYDGVGNRTKAMDARFNTAYYFYDGQKRTTAMRDALGDSTYYFYDLVGNRTAVTDPRNDTTYYFYDALNRQSAVRDALGNLTYFFYDAVGNRTQTTDARGNISYSTYDALNRQSTAEDAAGNAVLSGYDAVGNLVAIDRGVLGYGLQAYGTTPYGGQDGASTYFFYDGIHRRTALRDAVGSYTYYFYDATGDSTAIRNPLLHTAYFGYDADNRLVRSQDPTGATTYFEYDAVGNKTKVIDPDNHAILYRYDKLNRPDSVRYADTGSTYFFYDPVSNRTKDLDPLNKATYFGYDTVNRLTRIQDALGRTAYFQYDPASNRSKYLDAEGASSTFTYDALNRPTNIAYAVAGVIVADGLGSNPYYVYDPVSNLTQVGDLWGLHRMGYDPDNRISQHQFPSGNVVYFSYDSRSNITAKVYPGTAGTAGAAYDNLDRQTLVQAPSGATAYFSYDVASNLTQRLLGNNAKLTALYDAAERVQSWRYANSSGGGLSYFDYTRDKKGLITKSFREATNTVYYAYDANDRLLTEIWAKSGNAEVYGYRYAYDLAGNRTKARINGTNTYYSYDQANQLTKKGTNATFASPTYYKYDKNGSLTDLVESGGTTKHAYNAAGLIARTKWRDASFTYYYYDGALKRYALNQNGTLNYFLWDGFDILQEQKADGTVQEEYTQSKSPVLGIGQLVETNRPGATPQKIYPVMDPRGTITKYVQSDGTTVLASREYDAFGNLIPNSTVGTWPGIFGYQGQAWTEILSADKTQRLLLSPTRVYDPSDGHFVSKDPLALKGPGYGMMPYIYVVQNPVLSVDPTGRETWQQIRNHVLDAMGNVVDGPDTGPGSDIGGAGGYPSWFNPLAFNPLFWGGSAGGTLGAAAAWAAFGGLLAMLGLPGLGCVSGGGNSQKLCCVSDFQFDSDLGKTIVTSMWPISPFDGRLGGIGPKLVGSPEWQHRHPQTYIGGGFDALIYLDPNLETDTGNCVIQRYHWGRTQRYELPDGVHVEPPFFGGPDGPDGAPGTQPQMASDVLRQDFAKRIVLYDAPGVTLDGDLTLKMIEYDNQDQFTVQVWDKNRPGYLAWVNYNFSHHYKKTTGTHQVRVTETGRSTPGCS